MIIRPAGPRHVKRPGKHQTTSLLLPSRGLVVAALSDVEAETLGVEVDLVVALLEDGSNVPGVLKLPQLDVAAALLDGVTDQLGGTGLTLCAHDAGLLLLSGLVDNKGGALGFLLGYLLCFHGGGELGREGKVLDENVSGLDRRGVQDGGWRTVNETSSSMMLNRAALRTRLSLTSLLTFSLWVMS